MTNNTHDFSLVLISCCFFDAMSRSSVAVGTFLFFIYELTDFTN
jgi:hypothetical protein